MEKDREFAQLLQDMDDKKAKKAGKGKDKDKVDLDWLPDNMQKLQGKGK